MGVKFNDRDRETTTESGPTQNIAWVADATDAYWESHGMDQRENPKNDRDLNLSAEIRLANAWNDVVNRGKAGCKPTFSPSWWPQSGVDPPTEHDVLRVISLAGLTGASTRFLPSHTRKSSTFDDKRQVADYISHYLATVDNVRNLPQGDKGSLDLVVLKTLCFRVLNLRVSLQRDDAEAHESSATELVHRESDNVPLLISVITLLALKTLACLATRGELTWEKENDEFSSRSLLIEDTQVPASALIVPPVHHISHRELWAIFTEFSDHLRSPFNPTLSFHSMDETFLFINVALHKSDLTESCTKRALIEAWFELMVRISPNPPPLRTIAYCNCLEALTSWVNTPSVYAAVPLSYTTTITNLTTPISHHLICSLHKPGGTAMRLMPSQLHHYRALWRPDVNGNLLTLIDLSLRQAGQLKKVNKSRIKACQLRYLSAAVHLAKFMGLVFQVQSFVKAVEEPDDSKHGKNAVFERTPAAGATHKRRLTRPTPQNRSLVKSISVNEAYLLIQALYSVVTRMNEVKATVGDIDGRVVEESIVDLVSYGLTSARIRVDSAKVPRLIGSAVIWRDLARGYAALSSELDCWPVAESALWQDGQVISIEDRHSTDKPYLRSRATAFQALLIIVLGCLIGASYAVVRGLVFSGHWMLWLPETTEDDWIT